MANTSISNLSAGAAVAATDVLPNVQTAGVGPVKTTAAQLKTFMSASPTLVTPTLGVAAGTSLALGGATIGSSYVATPIGSKSAPAYVLGSGGNTGIFARGASGTILSLAASGTAVADLGVGGAIFGGPLFQIATANDAVSATLFASLYAAGNNILQLGPADASSAVAQTLQFQSSTGAATTGPTSTIVLAGGVSASGAFQIQKKVNGIASNILDWHVTSPTGFTFADSRLSIAGVDGFGIIWDSPYIVLAYNGSGKIGAASGGAIVLSTSLLFSGTTSSFPALKRSTTTLQVKLADDSAFTTLEMGIPKFSGTNTTGSGAALLASNSPASTLTAPYTWIQIVTSDGSTAYIPAWK